MSHPAAAPGEAYLAQKATEEGIYKLPSGMLIRVLKKGSGVESPLVGTSCDVHYHGTFIDGGIFDSSVQRNKPSNFAPNQVIKGWTEALQLMREGDKWETYIPYQLAYGEKGRPPKIPPFSPLVFTIEILKIHGKGTPVSKADEFFKATFGQTYAEMRDMETMQREKDEAEAEAKLMAAYAPQE